MADRLRNLRRAVAVPSFKVRIMEVAVIVACFAAALATVSVVVVMKSAAARDWSNAASTAFALSGQALAGAGQIEKAQELLLEGDTSGADQSFVTGKEQLQGALAGARTLRGEIAGLRGTGPWTRLFLDAAESLEAQGLEVVSAFEEVREATLKPGTPQDVGELASKLDSAAVKTSEAAAVLSSEAQAFVDESSSRSRDVTRLAAIAYPLICAVLLLLTAAVITVTYRGVTGIILDAVAEVRKIASGRGDLTARVSVPTRDVLGDLGDAINDMLDTLQMSMLEIRSISSQLSNAAEGLALATDGMLSSIAEATAATEHIARGAEDQARKVEGTSTTIGGVAQSIEDITDRSQVSAGQSDRTAELAERGVDASARAALVMREIVDSVEDSAHLVDGLGERFTQIGIIIDVITDIADQTNLLALNAAIEAARAGEHGKGFAVVAGEVRKLAENSKRSAEQISHLIREIMSETGKVTASMDVSTNRVEAGLEVAEKTGEALEGIMDSSRAGARAAGEISSAIQAIAANSDQVMEAISDIAAIAQETAASTEEVTATISEQKVATDEVAQSAFGLAGLAAKLNDLTQGFKLQEGARGAAGGHQDMGGGIGRREKR